MEEILKTKKKHAIMEKYFNWLTFDPGAPVHFGTHWASLTSHHFDTAVTPDTTNEPISSKNNRACNLDSKERVLVSLPHQATTQPINNQPQAPII
jgi:hypothetical protein